MKEYEEEDEEDEEEEEGGEEDCWLKVVADMTRCRLGSSSYHLKDKGGSDDEYYGDYYGAEDGSRLAEAPKVRVPAGTTGIRRFLVLVDAWELLDTWGTGCGSEAGGGLDAAENQADRCESQTCPSTSLSLRAPDPCTAMHPYTKVQGARCKIPGLGCPGLPVLPAQLPLRAPDP